MYMWKIHLIFALFVIVGNSFGQDSIRVLKVNNFMDRIELNGNELRRYFIDGSIIAILQTKGVENDIGTTFRVGNNFFYGKNKKGLLRLTWIQLGLTSYTIVVNPLNLGIGPIIKTGINSNLELTINGGIRIIGDDVLDPSFEIDYLFGGGIKFNRKGLTFSFDYGLKDQSVYNVKRFDHFLTLSVGTRF